jgi:hypothetical protein
MACVFCLSADGNLCRSRLVQSPMSDHFHHYARRVSLTCPFTAFVEYITILQHREGWHQIGALLTSLAQVQTYAFDLSQEMKMGYTSPKMPVELHVAGEEPEQTDTQGAGGLRGVASMLLGKP